MSEGFGLGVWDEGSWPNALFLWVGGVAETRWHLLQTTEIYCPDFEEICMMNCNSMITFMLTNLKKLSDSTSNSNLVDPTMYRELIGSLMYLVNTRPNICFEVSTLSQFYGWAKACTLGCSEACVEVPDSYNGYGLRDVSGGEVRLQKDTYSD